MLKFHSNRLCCQSNAAARNANIYDICDQQILQGGCTEPGQNLRLVYKNLAGHLLLKYLVLKDCRHPDISRTQFPLYQSMMRKAMHATIDNWQDPQWITATFEPLARLLDKIENPSWQIREKIELAECAPAQAKIQKIIDNCLQDVLRIWRKDKRDPWFPVAAQVVLSGDDHMDGESFLNVLQGVGSFEYKNTAVLFALIRCFLMSNSGKLRFIRKPYPGVCEPMSGSMAWLWHRIAFSDACFFEHLLVFLVSNNSGKDYYEQIIPILENLLRYCVVTSQEWLITPNNGIRHPAITCLPKDSKGQLLCRLTKYAWQKNEI
jgi:hypothetical protein